MAKRSVVTRKIMTRLSGQEPMTAQTLPNIQNELELLGLDISPRKDRLCQTRNSTPQDPNDIFSKWAGLLLSALADRNWSYLYYPLSHMSDRENWEATLDRCSISCLLFSVLLTEPSVLEHSRAYVEKMVSLTCLREFGPLQWSWPGYVLTYFIILKIKERMSI